MPAADPRASFAVAVRHLFHHLDDANALRKNPLVSRYFEENASGRLSHAQHRAALGYIRSLIIAAAGRCRESDIAGHQKERALRQFTIIERCCLKGEPIADVAAELGISLRQCYRERSAICLRVASFIRREREHRAQHVESVDEHRFAVKLAVALAEVGEFEGACREFGEIVSGSASAQQKIEGLCRWADVQVELGALAAAESSLLAAAGILASQNGALPDQRACAARCDIELVRTRLAWASADPVQADQSLKSAQIEAEHLSGAGNGGQRIRELQVTVLVEATNRALERGEFLEAQAYLDRADAALSDCLEPSVCQRVDLMLARARLQLASFRPGSFAALQENFIALAEARQLARSCSSPKREIEAELLLADRHVDPDNGEEALDTARRVLGMASKLGNKRLLVTVSVGLADLVCRPRFENVLPSILSVADQVAVSNSLDWAIMTHIKATSLLQRGDARGAWSCGQRAAYAADRLNSPRLATAASRVLALAAHQLGHKSEAVDRILYATQMAERYASPWSCLRTYAAAASLTGKKVFERAARGLSHTLTA